MNKITKLFLKYTIPNIISIVFISIYFLVDEIFVGQIFGAKALGAVGLVMPFVMIGFSIIDVVAMGSSVQISLHLGAKKRKVASGIFSFSLIFIIFMASVCLVFGVLFARQICDALIEDKELANLCFEFAIVYIIFYPVISLLFALDNYLRIAKKPLYSMAVNVIAALLNIILDYLFLVVFGWGLWSAALASCISMSIGALIAFLPFVLQDLNLKITKIYMDLKLFTNIIFNGSSGFLVGISSSIFMVVANSILLDISGTTGVAVLSAIISIEFLVSGIIMGMCDGVQPLFSYQYGARNKNILSKLYKIAFFTAALISILGFILAQLGAEFIIAIFSKDAEFIALGKDALMIFSLVYLCSWFVKFCDTCFTSTNQPMLSFGVAIISDLLPIVLLFVLVEFFGINGVWITVFVAKFMASIFCIFFIKRLQVV
ncbi:MatE efflux family protein [Campylobacter iguaniorum]|uniref:MatE efflux family protein n=1 Tax=Campylobacter iguaniorum TaxID=1244531 RepID=A0A076FAH6_9BACT|nr:MATE family efflux transporter [Campylobacter iguaniorum]AII14698.1 MatE efflux family protein [Campylobacter iguaniorum]